MEVVNDQDHAKRAVQLDSYVIDIVQLVLVLTASSLFKMVYCV